MKELPERFYEWLGGAHFLGEICPASECSGKGIQRIAALSHDQLAEGRRVLRVASLELVRGGLFYAVDALSKAHVIFQEDPTALGAYWHGMMHRREGDFGNACYWFGVAGNLQVLEELPGFDPVAFTRRRAKAGQDTEEFVEWQRREWAALMRYCLREAVGSD